MNGIHPHGVAGQTTTVASDKVQTMTPTGWTPANHRPRRYRIGWPLAIALVLIAAVWLGGAVWSFAEQTALAEFKHFQIPQLLPLVIDGLAVAMAAIAWAASLDGRPAVYARLGAALAVAGSATSNATWAWERSGADSATIALAVAVPIAANVAFEVLLAEVRKQVQRFRGVLPPVQIPYPHWQRMWLSPWSTFWQWRRLVLKATDMTVAFAAATAASGRGSDTPATHGFDTPPLMFLQYPYSILTRRFRTVPDGAAEPLDGTPTGPRHPASTPANGTGADTPAPRVLEPLTPTGHDALVGVPADGSGTVFQHPDRTPIRNPDTLRAGRGSIPAVTSNGTPTGTPAKDPANTPGRDGADTPAEYPADTVLLPVLRNPSRVPRETDGTVPVKRAMRVLKIGRDRAIRILKAEGLLREPLDDTPDDETPGTPADPINGSTKHPDLAGVSS